MAPGLLAFEEALSAAYCSILVRFMAKPYYATRENRYLGLPLGFGFLGVTYVLSSIARFSPFSVNTLFWVQLLARPFAFLFLAFTYYFSKKLSKKTQILYNIILSVLFIALTALVI